MRLFEAAACGTPIVSDRWAGLDTLLKPGEEIVLADDADAVATLLCDMPEARRQDIAARARRRVLSEHTAACRAEGLERDLLAALLTKTAARVKA